MSSKWIIKDNSVMLERAGKPPLLHSILINPRESNYYSYSYWDYEAWIMSKFKNKKILMLGLGGATSLQILEKLKIPLQEIIGVDIMANQLKREELLNFENLKIVEADAHDYLRKNREKYDLILVDVYDDNGYVKNVYTDIELLKSRLNDEGILALHCYDPMIMYSIFDLKFNVKSPLITFYFLSILEKNFNHTIYLPWWTSSLILSSNNDFNNYLDSKVETSLEYRWLDTFINYKIEKQHNGINNNLTEYTGELSYEAIDKVDKKLLSAIYHHPSSTNELKKNIKYILGKQKVTEENISIIENESYNNIKEFEIFVDFMLNKNDITYQSEKYDSLIRRLDHLDSKASKLMKSFIYSYQKKWSDALSSLSS